MTMVGVSRFVSRLLALGTLLLLVGCSTGRTYEPDGGGTDGGGTGGGGTSGAAGRGTGTGGAAGASGATGTGGASGATGKGGAGGAAGTGGAIGTGGTSGTTGTGGASGAPGTGGASGAKGTGGASGAPGTGGTATGGAPGTGGTGTGGAPATGGTGGTVGCSSSTDCSGTCMMCNSSHACVPATNEDDPNGRCPGTCDSNGACKSKQGQLCNTTPGKCISGTTCAPDGYCCDMDCSGPCVACDIKGFEGTCTNLAPNASPHSNHASCAGTGSCAGYCGSAGACVFPTTTCGSLTCSGTGYVDVGTCSTGTCVQPAAKTCSGNFVCAANACKTSCAADGDCASGYFCEGGACRLGAKAVSCAAYSCALLTDGTVRCWGSNTYGQLGNGSTSSLPVTTPGPVTGLPGPVAQIVVATGGSHTCAVLTSGDVWCWGYNSSGELGDGTVNNSPTPVKVGGLAKAASAVGAGSDFSCAILTDGSMACWGSKFYGVLGDGMSDFTSVLSAQAVPNLPGTASNLALGWNDGCATIAGSPYCWGWNGLGQIGNGLTDGSIYGVTKVGTASITAVTTAMGGDFGCFLQAGGVVQCWGYNNYGQVGNGTISTGGVPAIASPKFVTGLSSVAVVQLAVGGDFACVLTGTGTVYCWGNNSVGQLGTGSLSPASNATPGLVSGLPKASAISAGCALMPNGSVWSWGANVGATPVEVPGW